MHDADPLGQTLHFLRMSGTFYCSVEVTAPWAVTFPARERRASFHVVTTGRCWLEVEGEGPVLLEQGDTALVPHGQGHRLADDRATPDALESELHYENLGDLYTRLRYGGGGATTSLVCGAVKFEHPAAQHLIELLPPIVHAKSNGAPQAEWLQSSVSFMASEARELRPGGETIVTRLADIIVIQALRTWLDGDPTARRGWLGALRDKQIGQAIAAIHRDAGLRWSVASLAREVGMSRSAFASRFTELVGESVIYYVTRWRMHVAAGRLRSENDSVAEIASRLGYQSEAAFGRAFKRMYGISPGAIPRPRGPPSLLILERCLDQ